MTELEKTFSNFVFVTTNTSECDLYDPDNVFKRFKVVEFPLSFVGLSITQYLYLEFDLNTSAYIKTMHEGTLLKFEEARELSATHRAFEIKPINGRTIMITFKPKTDCISKAKRTKNFDSKFVFDLRVIKVDGSRCCNNEFHSEIARYYVCGEFDYCNISNSPKLINFGEVIMNTKTKKYVRIKNHSLVIAAKIEYVKILGFEVTPQKFTINPNSSKRIAITTKPTSLKLHKTLTFKIRNPQYSVDEDIYDEDNFLKYTIRCTFKIMYQGTPKELNLESLMKIDEQNPAYTYINEELQIHRDRKSLALKYLEISKISHANNPIIKILPNGNETCYPDMLMKKITDVFCKTIKEKISSYDLNDILFIPFCLDFGRVGIWTHGEREITIKNNSKYDITINFMNDEYVSYTKAKLKKTFIKLKSFTKITVNIFCYGFAEGLYKGTFEYTIDKHFFRKYPYSLQVGNSTILILEKALKFGMVTTDSFVTSVPIRIYNTFNVTVNFRWEEIQPDTPFEIIPISGSIPSHTCKICDVIYNCKSAKTKTHEVDILSISSTIKSIPIELNVITRKLSIKFLQPAVVFKDIALNLETVEKVQLENSSRELALFTVMEPLIPGITIKPMNGTIRPKTIIILEMKVKISCVLEFAFDVYVKINNKENVVLSVSGNVLEPKLIIHPKSIYMARVPCNMVTYVPVTFQNTSPLKSTVEVLDTEDENMFDVYIANGNEKQRIFDFVIDGGQTKTLLIKVFDIFRREYEMYLPFRINGLLGPPNHQSRSTELQYYLAKYEQEYENNLKVKVKSMNKDISYCRIIGVITVPWIELSVENFYIEYNIESSNMIDFTVTNVSKYYLHITILTSKLSPNFTLDLRTEENQSIINESNIKFELDRQKQAAFSVKFHPKGHGKFVSTALLYLDKHMTIPYSNLTFYGKRETPAMMPDTHRIIFPPTYVGTKIDKIITLKLDAESDKDLFSCVSRAESNVAVSFIDAKIIPANNYTLVTVKISVCCETVYGSNLILTFNHEYGSSCEVQVNFCFTYCPLTLHNRSVIEQTDVDPYPYFPLHSQTKLYDYFDTCSKFLEKWMFQQGFRRDLYPVIPDTFHAISTNITSQSGGKSKGINVSYLNFFRRIAGPFMKHVRKITVQGVDESFKGVKEIHDTYKEVINLLRSRGANLSFLRAKFLLSYDQFVIYTENVASKTNADILFTKKNLDDVNLFDRLNKQSWIDFILQSYKVFVLDSCFFECVCVSSQPRDIIKILVDWYNDQIAIQHNKLRKNKPLKVITNITTDLVDGIALVSTILNYCPFMKDNFKYVCEIDSNENREGDIINNACLIIEAMNHLRLYFPLTSKDFLAPNFIQMLFLSVHLYVTLPMFEPKSKIQFNPPLLRSSTRQVAIAPTSQESLIFTHVLINNIHNNFVVEKASSGDSGKSMFLGVKFTANFVNEESCVLLVHGYNKTRIFDTYIVFLLHGHIGSLSPARKSKVTGTLYRPSKVDILVSSPFVMSATFQVCITDVEPTIPVQFENDYSTPKFCVRRLYLIDREITLNGIPKETAQDVRDHKLYLQIICLSTQIGNSWIWFRSEVGQFFIKVTTQCRWDVAIDTLQAKVRTWPMDPCSCGESCECYRTTVLMIPHRNDLMVKSLRDALGESASDAMMNVFDYLIESTTGKIILRMLLAESGTNMSDVQHILRLEATFHISSKTLMPRFDSIVLAQHTSMSLPLPITLPAHDKSDKYTLIFASTCGMDIRTYKVVFTEIHDNE